jgi:hypothetical protein
VRDLATLDRIASCLRDDLTQRAVEPVLDAGAVLTLLPWTRIARGD